jgi:hypothetical protein
MSSLLKKILETNTPKEIRSLLLREMSGVSSNTPNLIQRIMNMVNTLVNKGDISTGEIIATPGPGKNVILTITGRQPLTVEPVGPEGVKVGNQVYSKLSQFLNSLINA